MNYILYITRALDPNGPPGASRCLAPREERVAASQKKERYR